MGLTILERPVGALFQTPNLLSRTSSLLDALKLEHLEVEWAIRRANGERMRPVSGQRYEIG
jgi:hypothetical protein